MKVFITEAAWSDMLEIGLMIRRDNASRARTFVDELYARCVDLQFAPRAYPLLSGYEETGIRRRVHGNYLIFYRIAGETVEVVHVLNGAMDYGRILFPN